ncbi:ATP-binding cassette domain-containing protein [Nereida sp.]|uniref:ATP-binding cassette domain-containing protein n=1 Tax=Nereida sp. TaxID=2736090 RepID=UPI003F6A467B
MKTLLEARDVDVRIGALRVLDRVNFRLEAGEIVTIVGPNGSGKSTFLRTLIGAHQPTSGTVTRADGLRIGYIPQKLQIDSTLPITVARFLNLPSRVGSTKVREALAQAGVGDLAQRPMVGLSGGQLQRVLLARALLASNDVLVLDEATQGLDQTGSASFYRQIEEVRQTLGCAVLMVSHELHVVMAASDRVICLNGHVCCEGAPEHVASAPEYRALFGTGTQGALALYRHDHDHAHDEAGNCVHDHHEAHG